ncbi:kinetochore-associated protein NSL1 homolog isoform X1 [Pleurodeles waltl]|uniref:kinetochore-associated protein NSL1 homolog isoform X1 n=1 Tax=Pleurodeles waltl TaxID=8319 RepID=UPI0037097683
MAASPGPVPGMPVGGGMAAPQGEEAETPAERDPRVRCYNKRLLAEVLEMCSDFTSAVLQSQPQLCPEHRNRALQEARWNFETIVQENVTVDGLPWSEASESQSGLDIKILEDQFDEVIVDTATKRKYHPRKIAAHVSKTLKAEREILSLLLALASSWGFVCVSLPWGIDQLNLLDASSWMCPSTGCMLLQGHYQPVVSQEPIRCDPNQVSRMANLTSELSTMSRKLNESLKSLPSLIETTDGLSQVLSMHPVLQLSRTHKEVFSHNSSEENEKTMDLVRGLEITPTGTGAPDIPELTRKRKRSHSPESRLYPLRSRSKRIISLNAAQKKPT